MRFGFREMIFVLLLLAMPVAAYFFVFKPRNQQITEARAEIRAKQAKLTQLAAATRNLDDLGKEIDELAQAIELFEQKLPAERETEVILKQVWELAAKHQLQPKSIRTDKPVLTANYSELPIKMTIVGNFDGYYSFMLDLEKLRRITRMAKMRLEKLPETEDGQMQAEVVLSIFFESNQSATPTGGAGRKS